jgi:hypothetical protein
MDADLIIDSTVFLTYYRYATTSDLVVLTKA